MACEMHGWTAIVLTEEIWSPAGQWPRCTGCGHRLTYRDVSPPSTRSIALHHPLYIFTELRGRHRARQIGRGR
jgi:hypothetical protein